MARGHLFGLLTCYLFVLSACNSGAGRSEHGGGGLGQTAVNGVVLTRDAAVGAAYGTPGPRRCSTRKTPQNGALSAATARAYVICDLERVIGASQDLYLATNVAVQVAPARAYNDLTDQYDGIDTTASVHDISGTSVDYQCALPTGTSSDVKRCRVYGNTHATGKCIRITSGEWHCSWGDLTLPIDTNTEHGVSPPSPEEAE